MANNNLGLVLGGIADGATNTYQTMQTQARLNQAALDIHEQAARSAKIQADMDAAASAAGGDPAQPSALNTNQSLVVAPATPAALPTPATGTATTDTEGNSVPPPPPAPTPSPIETPAPTPTPTPTPAPDQGYPKALATGGMADEIRAHANNRGISPQLAEAVVAGGMVESGLNPNTANNGSSTGLMQFHPDTFKAMGGTNIKDPGQQIDAGLASYAKGARVLPGVLGRRPTASELYIYHQQGAAGGPALLSADRNASAIDTLVDAGVSKARATESIQKNWPHNKGEPIPSNPTVGQFISAYDARVGHFMNQPITTPGGTATPGTGNPADAQPAATVAYTGGTSGKPTIYDSPDGSGQMVTTNPRLATAQDNADAKAIAAANVAIQSGIPELADQGRQTLAAIQDRKLASQKINAGEIEARRNAALEAVSHVSTARDAENFYSRYVSNQMHTQVNVMSDGKVHVTYLDNDTKKPIGGDDFSSLADMKSKAAQMIGNPATYGAAMDAHDKIVADNVLTRAQAGEASQRAATGKAEVDAGIPTSTANLQNTQSAALAAKTAADLQDNQTRADIKATSLKLGDTSLNPNDREAAQRHLSALQGQLAPTTSTYNLNNMPATLITYGNGVRSTMGQDGQEYELGQQQVVPAAIAQANKQKVPLTYGKEVDEFGSPHFGYSIAGHPELGFSPDATGLVLKYRDLVKPKPSALPQPSTNPADDSYAVSPRMTLQ